MNFLLIAGILSVLLGLIHSFLGEKLIFNAWRLSPPDIPRRHYNILWASWHLVTCLGLGLGGGLIWFSKHYDVVSYIKPFLWCLVLGYGLSGVTVLYGTRGKHPGWVVLLIIAVCLAYAAA